MIEFENISKSFNGRQILNQVSGKFLPGNNSLIIGASGTGKSVLLKCLVGLVEPDSGDVKYNGRSLITGSLAEKKQIRRDIGMLFQGAALFDSKTVEENVRFPLDMIEEGMTIAERNERVNFCLKRVGLEGTNNKFPSELSGGMKKRVGIARAIVLNPKYLFVDEPNSGLDPMTSIKIDQLINDITNEYNITTVVVTHDMNSVMEIGEYIMFLHKGKKVWEGHNRSIMTDSNPDLLDFVFATQMMQELKSKGYVPPQP